MRGDLLLIALIGLVTVATLVSAGGMIWSLLQ